MNYFNTSSTMDHDSWVQHLKGLTGPLSASFALGLTTHEEGPSGALGGDITCRREPAFSYFITIAFPTNHKYTIKHVELRAHGDSRIVFSPIKYGDCTQNEQYQWLIYTLRKHIVQIADGYDLFFEQTKEGNLHIHGRLAYDGKKMTMKDVKSLVHRMFDTPSQYKRFVDIKPYDHQRWSDYSNKKEHKQYQTLNYEHFKSF